MNSYNDIKKRLLKSKDLFEDRDFPPNNKSVYGEEFPADRIAGLTWKRPKDIVSIWKKPHFIVDGVSRRDLDQGSLGNCWFVAAAATLTLCPPEFISRVIPSDQSFDKDYVGIFRFNFWWYGKWVEVIIDDFLPCDSYGLIYCSNHDQTNEFWPALLEKAYAKLNGSYSTLNGGKLQDALMDLTGGLTEVIDLADKSKVPLNMYDLMMSAHRMDSLIGASIHKPETSKAMREIRKPNGLYQGHAYSITDLRIVDYKGQSHKLLRIRNPWGRGEWNGAWSDGSPEMDALSSTLKKSLKFQKCNDGEFWISEKDFVENFDEIQFCHMQPDSLTKELALDQKKSSWKVSTFNGWWVKDLNAGGCGNPPDQEIYWSNPQYQLKLDKTDSYDGKSSVVVSLMQKNWSLSHHCAIGFTLYKLSDSNNKHSGAISRGDLSLVYSPDYFQPYRVFCQRFRLVPGHYVLLCSTFLPHVEGEFLLRLFSETPTKCGLSSVKAEGSTQEGKSNGSNLYKIYTDECGVNMQATPVSLYNILLKMFKSEFPTMEFNINMEMCRCLHVLLDTDKSGYLGLNEVTDMWKNIRVYHNLFHKFDKDGSGHVNTFELSKLFHSLGFPLSTDVLMSIIRRYGDGQEQTVNFSSLIMILFKLTTLFDVYCGVQSRMENPSLPVPFTLNEWLSNGLSM